MVAHHCMLQGLPPPEDGPMGTFLDALFSKADTDGDGSVDFPEFVRFATTSDFTLQLCPSVYRPHTALSALSANTAGGGPAAATSPLDALGAGSMLAQLMKEKGNALGLTNPKQPVVVACDGCGAPLVGIKMGITHFGFTFCNAACKARRTDVDFVALRAHSHAQFTGSGGQSISRALNEHFKETHGATSGHDALTRAGRSAGFRAQRPGGDGCCIS